MTKPDNWSAGGTFSRYWGLIFSLGVGLVAYAGLVALHWQTGTLTFASVPATLGWYFVAFAAFIGAVIWIERIDGISPFFILAVALIARAILLLTPPTLSDDVYRYIWDGYVSNQGISPYAYPIESPALDHLDNEFRAKANHPWMASPYLPVAQYLFAAITRLFPLNPLFFQIAMVMFDLITGLFLMRLLSVANLPVYRSLLYLWNPLVVIEIAHVAHVDAWMLFLMMASLWLTFEPRGGRPAQWLAPVLLALATLTKGLPVLLLPVLFWRWRWWQLVLWSTITVIPLGYAARQVGWGLAGPLDEGVGVFGALRIYAEYWNFNSGIFHWLEKGLLNVNIAAANRRAKEIMGLALAVVLVGVWFGARIRLDPRAALRLMAVPLMAYLLLTPTLHPWYLLILLAFVPFLTPGPAESRRYWLAVLPWLYLSGAIAFSYFTYVDPSDFREYEWVRRVEWLPTLALLALWLIGAGFGVWQKKSTSRQNSVS